jgi:hypothetical protein
MNLPAICRTSGFGKNNLARRAVEWHECRLALSRWRMTGAAKQAAPLASSRGGGLTPNLHGRRSEDSLRAGGGEMTLNVEGVVGGGMEG